MGKFCKTMSTPKTKPQLISDDKADLKALLGALFEDQGMICARYRELLLESAFQPIYSPVHFRPVGHEALVRVFNAEGNSVAPTDLFRIPKNTREALYLDRLCRVMHMQNYLRNGPTEGWLTINIDPAVISDKGAIGSFLEGTLAHFDFPAHRLVVEILESAISDEDLLSKAVKKFRDLGCLIALDDFGAGHSNFERIWRLAPEIVKLDRSMIAQAGTDERVRRILPSLVSLIHEAGCLALVEGIETHEQTLIALDADVEFLQGFHLGRPGRLETDRNFKGVVTTLSSEYKRVSEETRKNRRRYLSSFIQSLTSSVEQLKAGKEMAEACHHLLLQPQVLRCFLLDEKGVQIERNLVLQDRAEHSDPRFAPLADTSGANWFRRDYFRRALEQPETVHISRPYLSITDVSMCLTLSISYKSAEGKRVLCVDLENETSSKKI